MFKKSIKKHKNKHKGGSVFILASGPSINKEDLSCLKGHSSIGINASPLLEQKYGFNSQYYTVSDIRFITHPEKRKMGSEMLSPETVRVFRKELEEHDVENHKDDTFYIDSLGKNGFSFDVSKGFYFGASTTMLAIQLAYYLGFENIYLLGVDLKYGGENPRFYKEEEVQEYDAFASTQLANIRNAYLVMKEKGVNLYSCSEGSLLRPYLPHKSFNDVIKDLNGEAV